MSAETITYRIGSSDQRLTFSGAVIDHFLRHQQRWWQSEAGGQLFARFSGSSILVELATGPRPTDRRTRTSYLPDRDEEQKEILRYHAEGLHFIGDWHTHNQRHPQASPQDAQSIAESVRKSHHGLRGFVLVIVGTARPPDGLAVSLHDGAAQYLLHPDCQRCLAGRQLD